MKRNVIISIARLLLIVMWTYAGASKLLDYGSFRFALLGHRLFESHLYLVAWLVPVGELVIAFTLLFGVTVRIGFMLSFGLLLLLTVYILYMFHYYPEMPCSCGGVISMLSWRQHMLFNMFFMAVSLLGWLLNKKQTPRYWARIR